MSSTRGDARSFWGACLCTLALVLAACGGTSSPGTSSSGAAPVTVKLACDRELSEVFIWDLGMFSSKYGITPQCTEIQSYNESLQAVSKGSVDAGVLGIPQMATMAAQNLTSLKVIAGYTDAGQNIIVRTGLNVNGWTDLDGKKICAPLSTGVGIMVQIAMLENNVNLSSIHLTDIGFVAQTAIQALQNGTCDALAYWSPVVDQAVADGFGKYDLAHLNLNTATTVGDANGVLVAGPSLLGNSTLTVNFLKAYVASMNYFTQHPAQWASDGAQVTGTSLTLLKSALPYQVATYHVDLAAAQKAAEFGPKFGFATTDVSAQIPNFVDLSYLATATGQSESTLMQPTPWSFSP